MDYLDPFFDKELEVAKNPQDFNLWLDYFNQSSIIAHRLCILERALVNFPRSYKLWSLFLDIKILIVENAHYLKNKLIFLDINNSFDRALVWMKNYPLIWCKYLYFLLNKQPSQITHIRHVFNRSLIELPITQHFHIWPLFIEFAEETKGPTAVKIYSRFIQFAAPENLQTPQQIHDLFMCKAIQDSSSNELNVDFKSIPTVDVIVDKLVQFGGIDEAHKLFQYILDKPDRFRLMAISRHEIWMNFIDLLLKTSVSPEVFEKLVQDGTTQFPDQMARFLLKLAFYYTRQRNFFKVRSIYNSGIRTCVTVKDFTILFDSFTEFEERIITKLAKEAEGEEAEGELVLRMNYLENLLDQRPVLLNDLKIRQDVNNLDEWFERVDLFKTQPNKMLNAFAQALMSVNPLKAYSITSNPDHTLPNFWLKYANVYASSKDYKTASIIFRKSLQSQYPDPDDLVTLYIAWCQLELDAGNFDMAKEIIHNACKSVPPLINSPSSDDINYDDKSLDVHLRAHKSIRLWQFYLDLLQSFVDDGTPEEIKLVETAFNFLVQLKIITPMDILNQASFLEEWKYIEKSFAVYELGIKLFKYPAAFDIWNVYLSKAIHYKLDTERIRDLFEQCLNDPSDITCPPELCKPIYILYSHFEAVNGFILRSIRILQDCIESLNKSTLTGSEKSSIYADKNEVYLALITAIQGSGDNDLIRNQFERILDDEDFPRDKTGLFAQKFINFEQELKEYTRVRLLYKFLVELLPQREEYWKNWETFEIENGDEITFKEMIRLKKKMQEVVPIEPTGFVKAGVQQEENNVNPDEIELDM